MLIFIEKNCKDLETVGLRPTVSRSRIRVRVRVRVKFRVRVEVRVRVCRPIFC